MIDVNDNEFRLLKMTSSILDRKIANNLDDIESLKKYKKLAISIANKSFSAYIEKVNSYKHTLPLEEEYVLLDELDNGYIEQEELQKKLQNKYARYANDELRFNDLSIVLIDEIRNRKNLISGYLINLKNKDDYQHQLEQDNYKLIYEEKRKNSNIILFNKLENELKESFLTAEGRIDNELRYTSIVNEYEDNGLDLKKLLSDSNYLEKVYLDIDNLRHEKEELYDTTNICYENIPSLENKNILEGVKLDTIKIRYKFTLIKIVKLLSISMNSYNDLIDKRERLIELIHDRNMYVIKTGINFVVDPFSRIKISEQLDYLKNHIIDNTKEIIKLRRDINSNSIRLDEINEKNCMFLKNLNFAPDTFLHQKSLIDNDMESLVIEDDLDVCLPDVNVLDNEVVSIKGINDKFNFDTVREKTSSVIKHVYDTIVLKEKEEDDIEPYKIEESEDSNLNIENEQNIFCLTSIENNFQQINDNELPSLDFTIENGNDSYLNENEVDSNLFKDYDDNPFGDIYLFNNKSQENDIDDLPDIFWTNNKNDENITETESLDEQIKRLKLVS